MSEEEVVYHVVVALAVI